MKSRIIILSLCLAGALVLPAMALTSSTADVENNPPIAENLRSEEHTSELQSQR